MRKVFLKEMEMMLPLSAQLLTAAFLLPLSLNIAYAQSCNDKTLFGKYSYQEVGQVNTAPPFEPFVSERLITFDGRGNLSGSGYRNLAGDAEKSPVVGTYAVQSDCSVNLAVTVLREDGSTVHVDQVFGVVTEAGLKVQGVLVSTVAPAALNIQIEKVL